MQIYKKVLTFELMFVYSTQYSNKIYDLSPLRPWPTVSFQFFFQKVITCLKIRVVLCSGQREQKAGELRFQAFQTPSSCETFIKICASVITPAHFLLLGWAVNTFYSTWSVTEIPTGIKKNTFLIKSSTEVRRFKMVSTVFMCRSK